MMYSQIRIIFKENKNITFVLDSFNMETNDFKETKEYLNLRPIND